MNITRGDVRYGLQLLKQYCDRQYPRCGECMLSVTCAKLCRHNLGDVAKTGLGEIDSAGLRRKEE